MAIEAVATQQTVERPTRNMVALLGFLQKAEVDTIFERQPWEMIDSRTPAQLWREFAAKVPDLPPIPAGAATLLGQEAEEVIADVKTRRTYVEHYDRQADYSFASVPIGALLSPQWTADIDYVREIASSASPGMSQSELLKFTTSEGSITKPIVTGNQVLFTSPRPDLYADVVPKVSTDPQGGFQISVRAGSRPNYVQVAKVGDKLLLVNGVHKVCGLALAGYIDVPCVFREAPTFADTGIGQNDPIMTRLLGRDRPARVLDFVDPDAGAPFRKQSTYHVMQVVLQQGMLTPPALAEVVTP